MKNNEVFEKNIIMKFEYKNVTYLILMQNNEIFYGKYIDESISLNLSEEEINILNMVYYYVKPRKEYLVNCGNYQINGKIINFNYDLKSGIYSFNEIINRNYNKPDEEILIYLNNLFNNQTGKLYSKDIPQKKKMIRRFIKIQNIVLAVFIVSNLAISYIPDGVKNQVGYQIDSVMIQSTTQQLGYSFQFIEDAIIRNQNLSSEEKEFLKVFSTQLEENQNYINLNLVCKNFSELDIEYYPYQVYNKKEDSVITYKYKCLGSYNFIGKDKNIIKLYGTKNDNTHDFQSSNKSTLHHEVNHALTEITPQIAMTNKVGNKVSEIISPIFVENHIIEEMVNELFSREYYKINFNDKPVDGYKNYMPAMYALCEILDESTLRKYKFDSNDAYIVKNLLKYDNDLNKAYELICSLDAIQMYYDNYNADNKDLDKKEKALDELQQNFRKIYQIIEHYYKAKYHKEMHHDLVMALYLYKSPYENEECMQTLRNTFGNFSDISIEPKAYVAKDLIQSNPAVEVILTYSDSKKKTVINEDNRFVNTKSLHQK